MNTDWQKQKTSRMYDEWLSLSHLTSAQVYKNNLHLKTLTHEHIYSNITNNWVITLFIFISHK